jgi:hypothetical protein
MKHHLLNALLIIMVITLVLIPVIGIDTGSSPGKDQSTSARAEAVQMPGESEIEIQSPDGLGMLGTLDERDWALFQRLAELEPAQQERLFWLLEQYDTAGRLDAPATDGIFTDYDIELVSYVAPRPDLDNLSAVAWEDIPGLLDNIAKTISKFAAGFVRLGEDLGQFVVGNIESAVEIIGPLIIEYNNFKVFGYAQLQEDLSNFVFGESGLIAISAKLADVVCWALSYEVDMGDLLVELGPDIELIGDYITGEIPCILLFPLGMALELIPDWQDLTTKIYNSLPDTEEWPSLCDMLLEVPNLGPASYAIKVESEFAEKIFETIEMFVPGDLTVSIVGEGVTLPIAHPLKILTGLLTKFWSSIALMSDVVYTKVDSCGSDKFQDDVIESLIDINADLAAHDTKISNTLADVVEHRDVDLQVIEIKAKQKFLVSASEAGIPLEGVVFTSVLASKNNPVSFEDITAYTTSTIVRQGVYLVQIDLPSFIRDASLFAFEASHTNGSVEHLGFIVFDASG